SPLRAAPRALPRRVLAPGVAGDARGAPHGPAAGAVGLAAGHARARPGRSQRQVVTRRFSPAIASAADLKFLHHLAQARLGNFKSKSGTRIIYLLVPLFASEVRMMGRRDVLRTSEAGH